MNITSQHERFGISGFHIRPGFLVGVSVFCLLCSLSAQRNRNLADDSPFLPPGYKANMAAQQKKKAPPPPKAPPRLQQNLELRGFVRLSGLWRFCIFDKRTNKASWIVLKDKSGSGNKLSILEFDRENKSITIEESGHREVLNMKSPSGAPTPIAHLKAAPKKPTSKAPVKPSASKPAVKKPNVPIPRRRIVTPGK
jgi:hypothetical protein